MKDIDSPDGLRLKWSKDINGNPVLLATFNTPGKPRCTRIITLGGSPHMGVADTQEELALLRRRLGNQLFVAYDSGPCDRTQVEDYVFIEFVCIKSEELMGVRFHFTSATDLGIIEGLSNNPVFFFERNQAFAFFLNIP